MSFGPLNAGNISQFNTQMDQLIRQILQTESEPSRQLEQRRSSLQTQQEIFDQATSTISSLQTKAETLSSSLFDQRTSKSSNPSVIGVSTGPGATPGSYEMTVERLAKAHSLASHRIPSAGRNVGQFFGPGERRFNIIVQDRRIEVKFDIPEIVDETDAPPTNEDILRIITKAIRQANAEAGLNQQGFTATTIRDTSKTAKLIIKSQLTGSENQLRFEDPEGVLQVLGINPGVQASETTGGWINGPEGQNRILEEVAGLLQPVADLSEENIPDMANALSSLANFASRLAEGEGLPLAQSLGNVVQILTDDTDITENLELELAFDSMADLVDRLDDHAIESLSREFLRRAGDLRGRTTTSSGNQTQTQSSVLTPAPGSAEGERLALADSLDRLAAGIQSLQQGSDVVTAFDPFRGSLAKLTTQDRASLLQEFSTVLNEINSLGRKGGEELTEAFVGMVQPLFDLTLDERSSVAVEFLNVADIVEGLGTVSGQRAADELRNLGDLVESMSQPLSDPLETPYAAIYSVFFILPSDTKNRISNELSSFADQLETAGHSGVASAFQNLANAVNDPNIENNFTSHFNDFATAIGSLNLADRERFSEELTSFNQQINQLIPADQANFLFPNFQTLNQSIGELNQFQKVAFDDQMIALTESLDQLSTEERSVVREEMLNSLKHLRNIFPIDPPDGLSEPFTAFNGNANDLNPGDRNILAAELARHAQTGDKSPQLARVFDALSRATFYADTPGSFDANGQEILWFMGGLNEQERQELVAGLSEVANRLPGLIGEDSIKIVPSLRQMSQLMSQPVVFEAPAAQFLNAFHGASSSTGTFSDEELLEINRYFPELAQVLVENVSNRHQNLVQNLFNAGQSLARLSPGSQEALKNVIQDISFNLNGSLSGPDGQKINDQLNSLLGVMNNIETFGGLDAKFTLDGVSIIRGSNQVADLLDGVTFSLENLTNANSGELDNQVVRITIDKDSEGILQGVQEFIDAYNQTIDFVEEQTKIDGETGRRGALAGNQDYLRLRLNLRQAINSPIELEDGLTFLRDIGIGVGTGVNDSNHIRIEDPDALRRAIAENLPKVQALLGDPTNGAAARVADLVDTYLNPDGFISKDKALLDRGVERLSDRLDVLSGRLDDREFLLRNQFNGIAEQLIALGTQTQALQGIGQGLAF